MKVGDLLGTLWLYDGHGQLLSQGLHGFNPSPLTSPESRGEPCLPGHALPSFEDIPVLYVGNAWKLLQSRAGCGPRSSCLSPGASGVGFCALPVYHLLHARRPENSPDVMESPAFPASLRGIMT